MHIGDITELLSASVPFLIAFLTVVRACKGESVDQPAMTAYCPSCSVRLGGEDTFGDAAAHAQVHASVTGHPVHIVACEDWAVVETVSGEPSLPMWD